MNAVRVIKSNAEFFNSGTWAGGPWRRDIISARGDDSEAAMVGTSVKRNLANRELLQTL